MRGVLLIIAGLSAVFAAPAFAGASCPPAGYDRAGLAELKARDWAIEGEAERNAFAVAIIECLGAPDPALRDGVAYEALFHLLRNRRLTDATMLALEADLVKRLKERDDRGFARPFAALALSEVARADRIEAFLLTEARARLVEAAAGYVEGVDDYRGFDEEEGWRHGVAHGADLLMQLALNPAVGKREGERMLAAIAAQVAPPGHFYVYGEGDRLARPVLFLARRGFFSEAEWKAWLVPLTAYAGEAFASQKGLAWRHDTMAFLTMLYVNAAASADAADDALLPGLLAALGSMP